MGADQELIQQCREIFDGFDRDGDGSITELELAALLRSLGISPDPAQVEKLFHRGDENRNGLIDFAEFMALMSSPGSKGGGQDRGGELETVDDDVENEEEAAEAAAAAYYSDEELVSLFRAFDKDGNGFITAVELAHSMAKIGHPLSPRELADMMREADADGDGRISFQEFADALSGRAGGDQTLLF